MIFLTINNFYIIVAEETGIGKLVGKDDGNNAPSRSKYGEFVRGKPEYYAFQQANFSIKNLEGFLAEQAKQIEKKIDKEIGGETEKEKELRIAKKGGLAEENTNTSYEFPYMANWKQHQNDTKKLYNLYIRESV